MSKLAQAFFFRRLFFSDKGFSIVGFNIEDLDFLSRSPNIPSLFAESASQSSSDSASQSSFSGSSSATGGGVQKRRGVNKAKMILLYVKIHYIRTQIIFSRMKLINMKT